MPVVGTECIEPRERPGRRVIGFVCHVRDWIRAWGGILVGSKDWMWRPAVGEPGLREPVSSWLRQPLLGELVATRAALPVGQWNEVVRPVAQLPDSTVSGPRPGVERSALAAPPVFRIERSSVVPMSVRLA